MKKGELQKPIKCFYPKFCGDMTVLALCVKGALISMADQSMLRSTVDREYQTPPTFLPLTVGGGGGGGSELVVFQERAPHNVSHSC
jgi:hypothetical protein